MSYHRHCVVMTWGIDMPAQALNWVNSRHAWCRSPQERRMTAFSFSYWWTSSEIFFLDSDFFFLATSWAKAEIDSRIFVSNYADGNPQQGNVLTSLSRSHAQCWQNGRFSVSITSGCLGCAWCTASTLSRSLFICADAILGLTPNRDCGFRRDHCHNLHNPIWAGLRDKHEAAS